MPSPVSIKRLYHETGVDDGTRILVDGLWPRGIRRSEWPDRSWRPELAPSPELRRWYKHHPERFEEFARRYRNELDTNREVEELIVVEGPLTLVTAKRDLEHSHALVLRDYLEEVGQSL